MSCPYCPQTFTRNSNKRKHIARFHQKQTHHQPSTSTEFDMAKAMMMPEHIQISQSDVHTSRVVHETTNNFQTTIQITTTPNLIQKNSHLVNSVRPLTHKSGNNSINKSADQGFFLLYIAIFRNKLFVLASLFMFVEILQNLPILCHTKMHKSFLFIAYNSYF